MNNYFNNTPFDTVAARPTQGERVRYQRANGVYRDERFATPLDTGAKRLLRANGLIKGHRLGYPSRRPPCGLCRASGVYLPFDTGALHPTQGERVGNLRANGIAYISDTGAA